MAVRLYLLSTHYRQALLFGEDGLVAASRGLDRLRSAVQGASGPHPPPWRSKRATQVLADFQAAMDDDFNTAAALGYLFEFSRDVNRLREDDSAENEWREARGALIWMAQILGIDLLSAPRQPRESAESAALIDLLLDVRQSLRKARQFELADEIRIRMRSLGIVVEDSAEGSTWRHARPGE
jgi:cysteinyl-tRNA synthetase